MLPEETLILPLAVPGEVLAGQDETLELPCEVLAKRVRGLFALRGESILDDVPG